MDAAEALQKEKEVKLFNQSENNLTETSDATSFISDLFSFSIFPLQFICSLSC